jgi:hypothetical protein
MKTMVIMPPKRLNARAVEALFVDSLAILVITNAPPSKLATSLNAGRKRLTSPYPETIKPGSRWLVANQPLQQQRFSTKKYGHVTDQRHP